jgi:hypothetical protein
MKYQITITGNNNFKFWQEIEEWQKERIITFLMYSAFKKRSDINSPPDTQE